MAGNPARAEVIADLRREMRVLQAEHDRYRSLLASVAPHLLKANKPPPIEGYSAAVHETILALADQGYSQNSWIAEMGVSKSQWHEWKNQYPELVEVIDVALVKALAWWEGKAREAQHASNKTFTTSVYTKRVSEIKDEIADISEDAGLGDASKLVLLDLRTSVAGSESPPLASAPD